MLDETASESTMERDEAENGGCTFNFLPFSWRVLFLISAVTLICVWCANGIWEGKWFTRLTQVIYLADEPAAFGGSEVAGGGAQVELARQLDVVTDDAIVACATNIHPGSTVFFGLKNVEKDAPWKKPEYTVCWNDNEQALWFDWDIGKPTNYKALLYLRNWSNDREGYVGWELKSKMSSTVRREVEPSGIKLSEEKTPEKEEVSTTNDKTPEVEVPKTNTKPQVEAEVSKINDKTKGEVEVSTTNDKTPEDSKYYFVCRNKKPIRNVDAFKEHTALC